MKLKIESKIIEIRLLFTVKIREKRISYFLLISTLNLEITYAYFSSNYGHILI